MAIKRNIFVLLTAAAVFLTGALIQTAHADEFCSDDSPNWARVMNGEYHVSNNVWGSGAGVGEQCLDIDLESTYFKVVKSTHNSDAVASYPFIRKGCHWGGCTDAPYNPFPIKVGELTSAPFTWVVNTDGVGGLWNAAFEAWFSPSGKTAPNGGGELMIWIKYYGGAGPAGSKVATVPIGGHNWDVYFVDWTSGGQWKYIAYKIVVQADSVNLDLKDFIHDALTRGYLYTDWYLDNMEAGFEIWRDGQGLTSRYFFADGIAGGLEENYAPLPFTLKSPGNKKAVKSLIVPFEWNPSIDPNRDPIEYIFHLTGPDVDTTIAGIAVDSLVLDGIGLFQLNTIYTWTVRATDGTDTTEWALQRTFKTPLTDGVEETGLWPGRFSLSQNYPNPFNSTTEIQFELGEGAWIDLSVYNLRGEKVKTLLEDYHAAGRNSVNLDASRMASGMYYYQLKTPDRCLRRKMVIIQ
ncbi:T9SS type A sorting domain-containing protein [bacterium]|nr:T9SS type A sorting domain-containing protein [bacterium]